MKMKSIYVFVKLAESNCDFNVHKMLGIPRSSMWSYISDLEKTLGKQLINRKKQSLSFTAAGEEFIPYANKMYQTYEESLVNTQNSEDPTIGGDIFISTTAAIAPQWSMESIRKLYNEFPNLRLHITASDEITRDEENACDVLIRPFGDSEIFRKVWSINYHHGLFASQSYLDQMGTPISPEDLLSHHIIGYGEHTFSYYDEINWHLKGQGYGLPKLKPDLTINSTKAIFDVAMHGLGICSATVESNKIYSGNLVRVLPEITGPTVKTSFCVKKSATGRKLQGIQTFNRYFEAHLKQVGIKISPVEE
jgi:DNA-binding transcriptional LysR family regulator